MKLLDHTSNAGRDPSWARRVTLDSRAPNDIHHFGSKVLAASTQSMAFHVYVLSWWSAGVKGRTLLVSALVRAQGEPWLITTASVLHLIYFIYLFYLWVLFFL